MKTLFKVTGFGFLTLSILALQAKSQSKAQVATKPVLFEGLLIAGYVDHGAYFNTTGPGIKFTKKPVSLLLGLLPGLRIKKDKAASGAPENSMIMPSLGFGFTAAYKHFAVQVPLYYNAKTNSADGKWQPGVGLGYKF